MYQHPTDKTLVWKANGQKPNWLRELEARGGKAVEVVAANDNAPARRKEVSAAVAPASPGALG